MNQTKFDIFAPSQKWHPSKSLFHNHFVDALMLQIYFIFTTLAIVISNGVLLHKLYKKRCKSRADKIFIILSCSDLGVGVFSIPIISISLFKWNVSAINYTHGAIWIFTASFPYGFSWMLVVIIAIDRVLIVTKGKIYKNCITMKVLYRIIVFCLLYVLAIVILLAMRHNSFKRYSQVIVFILLLTELSFIFITIVAYIYLYHYVRSKSRAIANKRHGGADLSKKLTLTTICTYLCLLVFTLPLLAKQVIHFTGPISDGRINVNLEYWCTILPHSNSYANALLILYINRQNHKRNN